VAGHNPTVAEQCAGCAFGREPASTSQQDGDGTLITLRCINGSTDERPDQLVAMRVYMDERMIVSTRQRKVLALDDVVNDLKEGTGPADCGGWLVDVCDALTDHASEFIEELHDKIIDLEDNLLDQQIPRAVFSRCCESS
jgi:zinc transporter